MKISKDIHSPEELGQMLAQGRMLKGLSQRQLAQQLGVGQKWIWEMEQGKPGILMTRLFEMLEATNVRLSMEIDTAGVEDE